MHFSTVTLFAAIASLVNASPLPAAPGSTAAGQENNVSAQVVAAAVKAGAQALAQEAQTQGNCATACAAGGAPTVTMEVSIFGNPTQATCLNANTMQMTITANMKVQNCGIPNAGCVSGQAPQAACGLPAVTATMSFLNGSPANVMSFTGGNFSANTFTIQPVSGQGSYSGTMTVATPGCPQAVAQTTVLGMNFDFQPAQPTVNAMGTTANTAACTICLAFA